jgi:hypothetical protein
MLESPFYDPPPLLLVMVVVVQMGLNAIPTYSDFKSKIENATLYSNWCMAPACSLPTRSLTLLRVFLFPIFLPFPSFLQLKEKRCS